MIEKLLAAAAVLALLPAAASADVGDGVNFTPDVPCTGTPPTSLNTEALTAPLSTLSFRAEAVRAKVPAKARGKQVGKLTVTLQGNPNYLRYKLRVPRSAGRGNVVLLRQDGVTVTMRQGKTNFLSVHGLPAGTGGVFMSFDGAGRGLLAVKRTKQRRVAAVTLVALRQDGSRVELSGGYRC